MQNQQNNQNSNYPQRPYPSLQGPQNNNLQDEAERRRNIYAEISFQASIAALILIMLVQAYVGAYLVANFIFAIQGLNSQNHKKATVAIIITVIDMVFMAIEVFFLAFLMTFTVGLSVG